MSHIKPYTLNKKYKVHVRFHESDPGFPSTQGRYCVMSYDDKKLAEYCAIVISRNTDVVSEAWVEG